MSISHSLSRRDFVRLGAATAALAAGGAGRAAEKYPTKPVTVIVPYAPGGQGDVFARLIAPDLGQALGQSVIVENRPGATGALGTRQVVRAEPDGHTLLMGQTGEIAINGFAMKSPGYDTLKDLRAIALVGNAPLVLAVPQNSPFADVAALLQAARDKPGSVAYASSGTATPGHLAAAALAAGSKTEMTHIPYKGAGQAISDLIGGQVQLFFASASSIMPHIQGGRVRALAVSSLEPVAALPKVPTIAQTLPGFEFSLWGGYFAPAATPPAIVELLAGHINRIVQKPELHKRLESEGSAVAPMTPDRFGQFVRAEMDKYAALVKSTQAHVD
ncbi:Tripartite tricarboxylate transporter family receptor [Pigmentiphaga humi]|uniref:Tripartite tricarboxylate transporter family receptor n=1 Tax=Pigmentiphaga humi TaxID=2478468 RepID=A0A3P4B8U0_9BURK|nr:tripartite tricarboxylate transporter substrate binding protein [Pigmentiphaga humi]VCU72472.1 Tripartite tricarboxylate transporter family receptor [Pigmentiphaga humi]